MLDDSEAEAGTAGAAIAAGVDAVETFGEAWNMFGFDAGTVIADGNIKVVFVLPEEDGNFPVVWSVFDGVGDQVGKSAV